MLERESRMDRFVKGIDMMLEDPVGKGISFALYSREVDRIRKRYGNEIAIEKEEMEAQRGGKVLYTISASHRTNITFSYREVID